MVRVALALACLAVAACSFEIRAEQSDAAPAGDGSGTDADPLIDAALDALIDPIIDAPPVCAAPFVASAHGCHRFLQPATSSFAAGRLICQQLGADLVIAPTMAESMYVAMMSGIVGPDARTLLGLSLVGTTWQWVDGSPLVTPGLWTTPTEPEVGEDVAVLTMAGRWVGRNLSEAGFTVVCEK